MNITILANRDLASNIALNYLVAGLSDHQVRIFLSDKVGKSSEVSKVSKVGNIADDAITKPQALLDLQFAEQQLINEVIFPAIDNSTQQSSAELLTFEGLAKKVNSPLETLNHINQPDGLELLKQTQPDLILSIRFGKILKDPVIQVPRLGILNLHSSLLPRYQGVMATFWAMLNRESEYGTSLHWIDSSSIDTGPIISQAKQALNLQNSYLENMLLLYRPGCSQMLEAVNQLQQGKPLSATAQTGQSSYFTFPTEQDLNQFADAGFKLLDSQQLLTILKKY